MEPIKPAGHKREEDYILLEISSQLCDRIVFSEEAQVRQHSAVLLQKRFAKRRHWQMLPPLQQKLIKEKMLNALRLEQEKSVRFAIIEFVAVLLRYCDNGDDIFMNQIIELVYDLYATVEVKSCELGSSILAILADVAPKYLVPHIDSATQIFKAALILAEANGIMSSSLALNALSGMSFLLPFVMGQDGAETNCENSIPLIVKSLHAFAVDPNSENFLLAFRILENFLEYIPKLINSHISPIRNLCVLVSNNTDLKSEVRTKIAAYVESLEKFDLMVNEEQKLIEPIIEVVFKLMAVESNGSNDDNEYCLGHGDSHFKEMATEVMQLFSKKAHGEKYIPTLLQLVEPALYGQEPLPRRDAYMSIAVIVEGFSEAICNMADKSYIETMLDIVDAGTSDSILLVRDAAYFALGQLIEHLQPQINQFSFQIFDMFFKFLHQVRTEPKDDDDDPKHIDRVFYAVLTLCENLDDKLVPHLDMLMEGLLEAMYHNSSIRLRELALSAISIAANAVKDNMLPYLTRLVAMLQPYLVETNNLEDTSALQSQAIDTLAVIARTVGKVNFLPLATEIMNSALSVFETADDPNLCRALYNLFASLATVLNAEMTVVYRDIMNRVYESVISATEAASLDSLYLEEKEAAIMALKDFAEHTGDTFEPHLQHSYKNVFSVLDHPHEDIRKVSITALSTFVVALYMQHDLEGVFNAISILIPKISQIIHEDEEVLVVLSALKSFSQLLKNLKQSALPNDEICDIVFSCINDILLAKTACQLGESPGGGDEEIVQNVHMQDVVEAAGNLLPLFGLAMTPEKFSIYFHCIYPTLLQQLENAEKSEDLELERAFFYGVLAECFDGLKTCSGNYFEILYPVMLAGLSDKYYQARQNAVFGLGELVLNAEGKSCKDFPQILTALIHAIAKEVIPTTQDNMCAAIARVIITHCSLVPLDQILPVFFKYLPLSEDFDENSVIFKCLIFLYIQARDALVPSMEEVLTIALHVLHKKQFSDEGTFYNAIGLILEIRDDYPDIFSAVENLYPELVSFLETL